MTHLGLLYADTTRLCTDYNKVCNLWDDCGDGSDERGCANSFKCKDNQGIIPLSKKCNGIPECADMSDECNSQCSKDIINNHFLKVVAWIIGVLATVSNALVIYESGNNIKGCNAPEALKNGLLVALIGIGDFLIGIYLIFVDIKVNSLRGTKTSI